jgi:hypothetical protein
MEYTKEIKAEHTKVKEVMRKTKSRKWRWNKYQQEKEIVRKIMMKENEKAAMIRRKDNWENKKIKWR